MTAAGRQAGLKVQLANDTSLLDIPTLEAYWHAVIVKDRLHLLLYTSWAQGGAGLSDHIVIHCSFLCVPPTGSSRQLCATEDSG